MKTWMLALAALLVGCSGITTNARVAPGANLSRYHTFGWAPRSHGGGETIADQTIRSSLQQNLAAKGIVPATQGRPDFLVDYHTQTEERVNVTPGYYGGYYGYYGGYGGGYPYVTTYTEGTLIVDFIDPQSRQVFWRGTAEAVVKDPNNPDPNRIAQAVDKLMEKYPAQVAATPRQAL